MEVLVLASRTGDSDLGLAFSRDDANNARADVAGGDVENRTAWQGTNVPRLRLKQDGRRARNPARGFAAEAAKVAIALKGKGARHIYAAQK